MEAKFIIKGNYIKGNYMYNVKLKLNGTPPRCIYPREKVSCRLRTSCTVYFDHTEKIVKKIIYPRDLWYTLIEPDDEIEQDIIHIKNFLPDWQEIEIFKN
jgi:hypothetical protein